ncbi:hypothetical protein, partial [Flavobacterium sp.]|uniref:leucine-rich repeat domain-containing protein n=1 Tax=Flavobacterium sp. TaxID=239 RepID=UPI002621F409
MKQFYLLLAIFLVNFCTSQVITFTDPVFKSKLLQSATTNSIAKGVNGNNIKIDANNNQQIEASEALAVYQLNVSNSGISNLQEISNFTNLTSLICNSNSLTSLDVSMLANLQLLNCRLNDLTSLNVSGANALITLICERNELQSLNIQSLTNLVTLQCGNNNLTTLNSSANAGLITLSCNQNELNNLDVTSNTQLKNLNCSLNDISALNLTGLTALQRLEAASNNLTSIDLAPQTDLRYIDVSKNAIAQIDLANNILLTGILIFENDLTNLDVSMLQQLINLDCNTNNLTTLSITNLSSLVNLNCSANQLQTFTASNLPQLDAINCSNNQLANLNFSSLPELGVLDFSQNQITSFDCTPFTQLFQLSCSGNLLTSLIFQTGGGTLETVNASYNQLTTINVPSIAFLDLSHNNLTSINGAFGMSVNLSHNNLTTINVGFCDQLNVSNNQLTAITFSSTDPQSLTLLNCSSNNLITLEIPSSYLSLNADNNPLQSIFIPNVTSISNFSLLNVTNLEYVCTHPSSISLVDSKLAENGHTNTEVNSYCVFTPGGSFYTISGNQRYNFSGSSCSSSDPIVPNLKFNITNGSVNGTIISDESGAYSIPVQAGQHTVTPVVPSSAYYSISPTSFVANFPTQASPLLQNFCITANGTFPDIEVNLIPIGNARPGFDSFYKVLVKNVGTTVQSGSVVFTYDESVSDLIEAVPSSTSLNTGSVSWTLSNLAPFNQQEFFVTLNHNSPMETPALNSDDLLTFTAGLQTAAADTTPDNNISTLSQIVVNSFDPNDKTCLAGPTLGPEQVGKFVNYMIRFENTGTAAAERVIITDRIDTAKFDISTLTPLDSSHPFTTRISNGNRVEFIFENIQLGFTDETNDGYVVFKIKTVPTLVVGDTFSNSAAIYFDFNYPIFTNDAITEVQVLGTENFDWQKSFSVFPNPMNAELTVKSLTDASVKKIEVFNTLGQLVISVVQP